MAPGHANAVSTSLLLKMAQDADQVPCAGRSVGLIVVHDEVDLVAAPCGPAVPCRSLGHAFDLLVLHVEVLEVLDPCSYRSADLLMTRPVALAGACLGSATSVVATRTTHRQDQVTASRRDRESPC